MCILQISMQCYDRFFEIALDEKENAELFVEDIVGHVLLDLFGGGIVDEVTVQLSSGLSMSLHSYSISICAQCPCEGFVSFPHSQDHMKHAIKQTISSIFEEFLVTLQFDTLLLYPSQWECRRDAEISRNVPI